MKNSAQFPLPTMPLSAVIARMNAIKAGRLFKVEYASQQDTVDGSVLFKITAMTARTKLDKTHCKGYSAPAYNRTDNSTYIVSGAVKTYATTGSTLIVLFPFWKNKAKTRFVDGMGNPVDKATALANIKPRNKSANPPVEITPNALNILSI